MHGGGQAGGSAGGAIQASKKAWRRPLLQWGTCTRGHQSPIMEGAPSSSTPQGHSPLQPLDPLSLDPVGHQPGRCPAGVGNQEGAICTWRGSRLVSAVQAHSKGVPARNADGSVSHYGVRVLLLQQGARTLVSTGADG
jgi:hypothetical protein